MTSHNAANERTKRQYFSYLKDARQQSEATINAVADALGRFEDYTRNRDFKLFRQEQAVAFKKWLAEQRNQQTGRPLSKATMHGTVAHLKRFFQWLANQPGFKSRVRYTDADYFNLSEKDMMSTARRTMRT